MKTAFITGQGGQDGYYLTKLLEAKDYLVIGFSTADLEQCNFESKLAVYQPDEIYNFAAISNVFNPYLNLDEILEINAGIPQMILELIRKNKPNTKFFQASSSLVFGDSIFALNEYSPRRPKYPYGAAKAYADNLVTMYREDFGIFAVSGFFFNHTSTRQDDLFFAKKVANAAKKGEKIQLGSLSAKKDYGYAPDYVEAAWLMLQAKTPTDYIIGTGRLIDLQSYVDTCFSLCGRNWKDYVTIHEGTHGSRFVSPDEYQRADSSKIFIELGWKPTHTIDDIIKILIS